MKNTDQPLRCSVIDGRLVISIGVNTLAFADAERLQVNVTNPGGFAVDVCHELMREDEIGASKLTDLLDDAMERAANNGSAYIRHTQESFGR